MNSFLKTLIKPDWDEVAGFYPPYIEKKIVYPELYKNDTYELKIKK